MAEAGFNASAYYSADEKSAIKKYGDDIAALAKKLNDLRLLAQFWKSFYETMSATCSLAPGSYPFTETEPVYNQQRRFTCDQIGTVQSNSVIWNQRLVAATEEYKKLVAEFDEYKKGIDQKYYNDWKLQQKKAEQGVQAEIASIEWAKFFENNAIWLVLAVIVIIFLIIRFRK